MDYTRDDLQRVMAKEPELVDRGIGAYYEKGISPEEKKKTYEHQRELLLDQVEEFNAACNWLRLQYRTKHVNENAQSSYGLKEYVEAWDKEVNGGHGFIANGVLIAAAIHLGFKYKTYFGSTNIYINISKKLVEANHGVFKKA